MKFDSKSADTTVVPGQHPPALTLPPPQSEDRRCRPHAARWAVASAAVPGDMECVLTPHSDSTGDNVRRLSERRAWCGSGYFLTALHPSDIVPCAVRL